jgi:hypothetical protein
MIPIQFASDAIVNLTMPRERLAAFLMIGISAPKM